MFTLRLAGADGSPDAHIETDAELRARRGSDSALPKGEAPAEQRRGPDPSVRGRREERRSRRARGVRALPRAHAVGRRSRAPRARAGRFAQRNARRRSRARSSRRARREPQPARRWIAKAEALVAQRRRRPTTSAMDASLARAAHARSGTNWRDAVPYYERVLALDPDNVPATLARVELYGEAGLRETALAFLERALARRPRSVALLRAMVDSLREEDRTTEADEMEHALRGAALRRSRVAPREDRARGRAARRESPRSTGSTASSRRTRTRPTARCVAATAHLDARRHAARDRDVQARARPRARGHRRDAASSPTSTRSQGKRATKSRCSGTSSSSGRRDKDVREYVAHIEPAQAQARRGLRAPSKEFLAQRGAPAEGHDRRTLVDLTVATVFPNGLASRFHQVVFQPLTDRRRGRRASTASASRPTRDGAAPRRARLPSRRDRRRGGRERRRAAADDPSIAMYTSAARSTFASRGSQPGDVVELQYRVEDVAQRNAFADYFGEVDYMQSTSPSRAPSTCSSRRRRARSTSTSRRPRSANDHRREGRPAHLPLRRDERRPALARAAAAAVHRDARARARLDVQDLGRDGRWYWGLVKDQFVADDEVRRRVAEITKGKTTRARQGRAVYDYVVQKTRYVALEFGIHGFKPYRCAQIFARGFGDCKDKATLIVTMLKELGIPATIVIVRTGLRRATSRTSRRASRRSITRSRTCRRSTSTSTAPPSTRAWASCPRWIAARSRCRSTRASRSSCTCPTRRRARASTCAHGRGDGRRRRLRADRLARDVTRRERAELARALPRRVAAQAAPAGGPRSRAARHRHPHDRGGRHRETSRLRFRST